MRTILRFPISSPSFYHHGTPFSLAAFEVKDIPLNIKIINIISLFPQTCGLSQLSACSEVAVEMAVLLKGQKVPVRIRSKTLLIVNSAFLVFCSKTKAGGPPCCCCTGKAGPGIQGIKGEAASGRT